MTISYLLLPLGNKHTNFLDLLGSLRLSHILHFDTHRFEGTFLREKHMDQYKYCQDLSHFRNLFQLYRIYQIQPDQLLDCNSIEHP